MLPYLFLGDPLDGKRLLGLGDEAHPDVPVNLPRLLLQTSLLGRVLSGCFNSMLWLGKHSKGCS